MHPETRVLECSPLPPTALNPLVSSNYPTDRTVPPSAPPVPHPLDSYWTAHYTSSLTSHNAAGPIPGKADLVIIGSGLTGSCAAAELVEKLLEEPVRDEQGRVRTVKVVVIEARKFCSGATGRNGGHLTAYPVAHFCALAEKYGTEEAIRAVKLEDEAISWLLGLVHEEGWEEDVDLQEGGGTLVTYDSPAQVDSVRSSLAAASSAGLDTPDKVRWFTSAEAREKYSVKCEGAVMVPGNNLFPLKFVTKLLQRALSRAASATRDARKKGNLPPVELELFTHTVASGVEPSSTAGSWVVKTDRGDIEATHVLHATNGYASSILPSFSSTPLFPGILPTRAQCLSLLPLSPSPSNRFSSWSNAFSPSTLPEEAEKGVNTYAFQRRWSAKGEKRGEVIIGGMREHAEGWEWGVGDDGEVSEEVGREIRRSLGVTWPGVFEIVEEGEEDERVEEEGSVGGLKREKLLAQMDWTGIMGYREDGNPIVGPVFVEGKKLDGQWIAAGYSGHGMPRAPLCGHLTASLIHYHLLSPSPPTFSSPSSLSSPIPFASPAPPRAPFRLPPHFPRHLLATPDGRGDGRTRLAEEEEGKGVEERDGWVWVEGKE
ncbi:hypothetical protein JCM8547_000044 [Rhodosporidiobolus lusitaniae]